MEWIEVTGRTIEEARERALDTLGVDESELEYVVLEEPKSGFLGIGKTEARLRARVKPVSREKPNDRRRRRGRGGEKRERGTGERPEPARRQPARREEREQPARAEVPAGGEPGEAATSAGPARRRRRRGGRGRSGAGSARQGVEQAGAAGGERPETRPADTEGATVTEASIPVEEQAQAAAAFTEGLVEAFGVDARVRAEVVDEAVEVNVEGEQLGLLVGPKGSTLAAIEELVRAAVQRSTGGHSARVHLDVAGYRHRRREALAAFARQQAEEVLAAGVERALEPMPAPDRKVVHDTVATIDGVTTTSEGDEPHRRVVIIPSS